MAKRSVAFAALFLVLAAPALADTADKNVPICPAFDQFPVKEKFSGPYKQPNLHQSKQTWLFRTQLRDASQANPTFAGYFNIAEWGCGTSCYQFAEIDRRTGKVFMDDTGFNFGLEYRLDSRLVLIDSARFIQKLFADEPGPMPQEGDSSPFSYTTQYILYDEDKGNFSKPIRCHQGLSKG